MDVVATFRVEYTQFLNPQGDATQSLPEFARDPAALLPLYRAMVRTRLFDAKAITLQRTVFLLVPKKQFTSTLI